MSYEYPDDFIAAPDPRWLGEGLRYLLAINGANRMKVGLGLIPGSASEMSWYVQGDERTGMAQPRGEGTLDLYLSTLLAMGWDPGSFTLWSVAGRAACFTHDNTSDRTYTAPDWDGQLVVCDVSTPPTDGQAPVWSLAAGKWLPGEAGGGGSVPVINGTGGTLPILTPVYQTAVSDQVAPADCSSGRCLGLLTASLASSASGHAQSSGRIAGTHSQWQAVVIGNGGAGLTPQDELWLGDSPGMLRVGSPPALAAHLIFIGTCISDTEVALGVQNHGKR